MVRPWVLVKMVQGVVERPRARREAGAQHGALQARLYVCTVCGIRCMASVCQ